MFLLVEIMDRYILYMIFCFRDLIDFRLVTTLNIQNFGPTKRVNNCEAFRVPHNACFTHTILPITVTLQIVLSFPCQMSRVTSHRYQFTMGLPAASPSSSKRSKQKRYAGSSKGSESTWPILSRGNS